MNKIRVVIAEDFTTVRKGIMALLQMDETLEIVGEAADGKELIEVIRLLPEPPEVALLDINMPNMDGHDTLVALKEKYPDMRFVMLSQHGSDITVVRMLIAGANAFLHKDADPKEISRAISTIMDQLYYVGGLVTRGMIQSLQKGKKSDIPVLTPREEDFLRLCTTELRYKEIANQMDIAESTAIAYREQLCDKLNVKSRTGLAIAAYHLGLLKDEGRSKKVSEE